MLRAAASTAVVRRLPPDAGDLAGRILKVQNIGVAAVEIPTPEHERL
jgi:hypothetical protein